jgi:hypothetical protein
MRTGSRFHANKVVRLATITGQRRFEMQFSDSGGRKHVVSLPLKAAVELACLICDASETAPYLVGGIRRNSAEEKA